MFEKWLDSRTQNLIQQQLQTLNIADIKHLK